MEPTSAAGAAADFQSVIDRLKEALFLPTNKAVAEAMGMTASNLGERKNRDSLPREQIDKLCEARRLSPKWVYEGIPPIYLEGGKQEAAPAAAEPVRGRHAPPLDSALMSACIEAVEVALEQARLQLPAARRARLYGAVYELSLAGGKVNRAAIAPLVSVAKG